MIKLVRISGRLRQASFKTALLRVIAQLMPDGSELEIKTLHDIPIHDGDLEAQGIPGSVKLLKDKVAAANGLILSTISATGFPLRTRLISGAPGSNIWNEVQEYLIGLGLPVLLTLASFYVARTHEIWGLESRSRASSFQIVRTRACRPNGFH